MMPNTDIGYYPFTFHSQPETAQDEWVIHKLRGKRNGFFIEIGAYDGVYHSNTLCLERELGWNGILIEANYPAAMRACEIRKALVFQGVISNTDNYQLFYEAKQWSGLKEFTRPNLIIGHKKFKNPIVSRKTIRLHTALNCLEVPLIVDYLSIDVEGAEYPILKAYFKSSNICKFRCMTIEIGQNQDDLARLIDLLQPLGYRLDRVCEWEAYFINPELLRLV